MDKVFVGQSAAAASVVLHTSFSYVSEVVNELAEQMTLLYFRDMSPSTSSLKNSFALFKCRCSDFEKVMMSLMYTLEKCFYTNARVTSIALLNAAGAFF